MITRAVCQTQELLDVTCSREENIGDHNIFNFRLILGSLESLRLIWFILINMF